MIKVSIFCFLIHFIIGILIATHNYINLLMQNNHKKYYNTLNFK